MPAYEYRVVPAPRIAAKEKGAKTTDARFAATLTRLMNELGADGWEYQRAETLPCDERRGLTGKVETTQHVLVFRREKDAGVPALRAPALGAATRAGPGRGEPRASSSITPSATDPQASIFSASAWMRPTRSRPSASCTARCRSIRVIGPNAGAAIVTRKWLSPPSRQPAWPRCRSLSSTTSRRVGGTPPRAAT